ncbi:MAG: Ig-like domain-containing protein [Cyclobacteriaceae bacterium]
MRKLLVIAGCCLANMSIGQVTLSDIPTQIIGREGSFSPINLNDYTSNDVFWEAEFAPPEVQDERPSWSVNQNEFQFEMNITATVTSKEVPAVGDGHLLAVTDDQGAIRSVGSAIEVGQKWLYFLTVYGNSNGEALKFTFYDDSVSQILSGPEIFQFTSNQVLGEPDNPHSVSVGNISFEQNDSLLSFELLNPDFIGSEIMAVVARNLENPNDFATGTITLTIADDYTPKLSDIPNQVSSFGEAFSSFDLDNYTTLQDSDPVLFSFSGNQELQILINEDNLVIITKPADWFGEETIIFEAVDQSEHGFSSSQSVKFIGKPEDQPPVISPLVDLVTGVDGFFEPLNLNDYVSSGNPEATKWTIEYITDSTVDVPDWVVNANEFQLDMSVTASVTALGKRLVGPNHKLAAFSATEGKIVGVTEPVEVDGNWLFFLTINGNTEGDSIYFKVYDYASSRVLPTEAHVDFQANNVMGDPLDPFQIEAGYILPYLTDSALSFVPRKKWDGIEIVKLTATDTATAQNLSDSDTIRLEVLNIKPPVLEDIPNQSIQEGSTFSSIDLSNHLKNLLISEVSFEISGADTLNPILNSGSLTFTIPNDDYFGEEMLKIKVASLANQNLIDVVYVTLHVLNVNDAPVISSSPPATAALGSLFRYDLQAQDIDLDELTVSVTDLPDWLFMVPISNGATFVGIPAENNAGEHAFTITVSDGLKFVTQEVSVVISLALFNTIDGQSINEGEVFSNIDLDDFILVYGDLSVTTAVTGQIELTASVDQENVLSVQVPDENWFGKETLTVSLLNQSNDEQLDEVTLIYEVKNVNDPPHFESNPSTDLTTNDELLIKTIVSDLDGDQVSFSVTGAPDWLRLFSETDGFTLFGQPDQGGSFTFDVVADDGDATTSITIQINVTEVLSTTEVNSGINLFPNPAEDIVTILSEKIFSNISIYDQSGKLVMQSPGGQPKINVADLEPGIYYLQIDSLTALKLIKN